MEYIQSNSNLAYMYNNNSNEQTYEHQNSSSQQLYENHYYDQHHQSYPELDVEQELWNSSQNYGNTSGSEQMQSPGSSIKSKNFFIENLMNYGAKIQM